MYEVANNEDNWSLYEQVGAKFGDTITGYPYMVIGQEVFNGYAPSDDEAIVEAIDNLIASDEPYDVVAEIESGNLDVIEPGGLNATGAVLAFIFGVVVVLVLLIGYNVSKKKNIKA